MLFYTNFKILLYEQDSSTNLISPYTFSHINPHTYVLQTYCIFITLRSYFSFIHELKQPIER